MQLLEGRPRATRYVMATTVLYRPVGTERWHEGRTVNVSRSGVLFETPATLLDETTPIEFILVLPSLGLPGHARVQCLGQVVRRGEAGTAGGSIAATIDAYDFLGVTSTDVTERVNG